MYQGKGPADVMRERGRLELSGLLEEAVSKRRVELYREYLKKLEELYREGRISEQACRRLKEEYEAKMREAGI